MSADIINLRQARKHKARALADVKAAKNRIAFGVSKSDRQAAEAARQGEARKLDGHRLTPPMPEDG